MPVQTKKVEPDVRGAAAGSNHTIG
jgi:hypothetical protein